MITKKINLYTGKKQIVLFALLLLGNGRLFAQSSSYNYIRVRKPTLAITTSAKLDALTTNKDSVQTVIQYVDGLGRHLQTIQMKGSPLGNDIIQPFAIDSLGKESKRYLPYVPTSTSYGAYRTDALTIGAGVSLFYNPSQNVNTTATQQTNGVVNTAYPYAVTGFEASPLNRVIEQGAPGKSWQLPGSGDANSSGHTGRFVYTANDQVAFTTAITGNAGCRKVAYYKAAINANGSRTLTRVGNNAYYSSGLLTVTIYRDENWQPANGCFGTVEEYKDMEGHVILKRRYNINGSTAEMLSTFYVYDDFGNLAFVLPAGVSPDADAAISQATLDTKAYQYRYDARDRLTEKKLPGKGWDLMVYNKLDQLVASQDSVQRMKAPQEWTVSKYDALGRPVITGVYQQTGSTAGPNNRLAVQALCDASSTLWEIALPSASTGYTANAWPTSLATILNINFYDDYANIPSLPAAYNATGYSTHTSGLVVATKTLVLNTTSDYLWTTIYYDDEGKIVRTFNQHYVGGATQLSPYNYDDNTAKYSFTKLPVSAVRKHYITNSGKTAATLLLTASDSLTYDQVGRQRNHYSQLKNGSAAPQAQVLLSQMSYNELGLLIKKGLHSVTGGQAMVDTVSLNASNALSSGQSLTITASQSIMLTNGFTAASGSFFQASIAGFLQTVDYRYNTRGWLTNINNPTLTADGGLTNTDSKDQFGMEFKYDDATTAKPQYNGNVATVKSKNSIAVAALTYDYAYDKQDRITDAVSTSTTTKDKLYSEYVKYDNMGNITNLGRYDTPSAMRQQVDSLLYNYSGYRLLNVIDTSGYTGSAGFKDGSKTINNTVAEYFYDGNGNMTKDANKGLSSLQYNILNLPQSITKADGSNITYVYDAAGRKLRKLFTTGGVTTTTEYVNGIEYDNSATTIGFITTTEGRARYNGSAYVYEYDLKDQLGNTRLTMTWDPTDASQTTPKVVQTNDYYAFGYTIQSLQTTISPKNEYLYNGKELQEETGLYDYGARSYDPAIGRWTGIDPMAEAGRRFNPYAYGNDNPISFIDPDGMLPTYDWGTGKYMENGQEVDWQQVEWEFKKWGGFEEYTAPQIKEISNAIDKGYSLSFDGNRISYVTTNTDLESSNGVGEIYHELTIKQSANQGGPGPGMRPSDSWFVHNGWETAPWYGNFLGPGPNGDPYRLLGPDKVHFLHPIDMLDAAAQTHDYWYDVAKTGGIYGALFVDKVGQADRQLAASAHQIDLMYNNGINDSITNRPISIMEYRWALRVEVLFGTLGDLKWIGNEMGR